MNMDTVNQYLDAYGYGVIFIFLFFGIVGIPAPEESLLVLIGILSGQNEERLIYSILTAYAGTFVGMLTAYGAGRFFGPTVLRYGRFLGLTKERWERVSNGYMERINRTIIGGLYIPGVRQINPYFAGLKRISFGRYFLCQQSVPRCGSYPLSYSVILQERHFISSRKSYRISDLPYSYCSCSECS